MSDFARPGGIRGEEEAWERNRIRNIRLETLRSLVTEGIDVKTSTLALMKIWRESEVA